MLSFKMKDLKKGLLLLWALYLSLISLTNLFDGLKVAGVLGEGWTFASGNYGFMQSVTAVHNTPTFITTLLFVGVLIWEIIAAGLMWRAWASWESIEDIIGWQNTATALTFTAALWAGFIVAEEIFIAYDVEATHWQLLMVTLVTVLVVRLLPSEFPVASA